MQNNTQRSVKGNECLLYGVCNGSQVSVWLGTAVWSVQRVIMTVGWSVQWVMGNAVQYEATVCVEQESIRWKGNLWWRADRSPWTGFVTYIQAYKTKVIFDIFFSMYIFKNNVQNVHAFATTCLQQESLIVAANVPVRTYLYENIYQNDGHCAVLSSQTT